MELRQVGDVGADEVVRALHEAFEQLVDVAQLRQLVCRRVQRRQLPATAPPARGGGLEPVHLAADPVGDVLGQVGLGEQTGDLVVAAVGRLTESRGEHLHHEVHRNELGHGTTRSRRNMDRKTINRPGTVRQRSVSRWLSGVCGMLSRGADSPGRTASSPSSFNPTPERPIRRAPAISRRTVAAAWSWCRPPGGWMFDTQLRSASVRPGRGWWVR